MKHNSVKDFTIFNYTFNRSAFSENTIRAYDPVTSNMLKNGLTKICIWFSKRKSTIFGHFSILRHTIKECKHIRTYQIMFE